MKDSAKEAPLVGGQALIEGVMMRACRATAIAVRGESGQIIVRTETWTPIWTRHPWLAKPLIRGAVGVLDALNQGFRALQFSAERAQQNSVGLTGLLTAVAMLEPPDERPRGGAASFLPMVLPLLFALGLFVAVPHLLTWLFLWLIGGGHDEQSLLFHLIDGTLKLGIFVGYVSLIGQIPEIARVFEYHGAEHKVVNAFERGRPLELDEARLQPTFHARCGTSFMLSLLFLSAFVFGLAFAWVPIDFENPFVRILVTLLVKIPLMFPIAGLAYELNRLSARYPNGALLQALTLPGRWMQTLTTRMPADDQLEIALAAMKAALHHEQSGETDRDRTYDSYGAFAASLRS